MRIAYDNWAFEIDDSWLAEADFDPESIHVAHYEADTSSLVGKEVFLLKISDINPRIRAEGTPIFNDGEVEGHPVSAKERTVSILKAIMRKSPLPPIEVVESHRPGYKYMLTHGCHRLHCSMIAGFREIPATLGFDINEVPTSTSSCSGR